MDEQAAAEAAALETLPPEFRALFPEDASTDAQEPESEPVAEPVAEDATEAIGAEDEPAEETADAAPQAIAPSVVDYLRETFQVTPEQFIADMEAQRQANIQQQNQQELEAYVSAATDAKLAEINGMIAGGQITYEVGERWYAAERAAAQTAWEASQAKRELAATKTETELTRIQAEFPGVPIDTLRELAQSNVPGALMRKIAADISKGATAAQQNAAAAYAQKRQAVNQSADAHRPATGRAADPTRTEWTYDQIAQMSYEELIGS